MENELRKIDAATLDALPAGGFEGRIVVVEDAHAAQEACDYLAGCAVIGFDTETRPCFKAGEHHQVALLQFSSDTTCFLFRLNKMALERPIIRLLEDKSVTKVGLDIKNDLHAIQRLRRFRPEGFVDLQAIIRAHGIDELGLRKMAAIVLGIRISKAQRLSNWEAPAPTEAQQLYAATDAWVSRQIYITLNSLDRLRA